MALKTKGVCDVCNHEFELNGGNFAVKVNAEENNHTSISIYHDLRTAPEDHIHCCGQSCLFRHIAGYITL